MLRMGKNTFRTSCNFKELRVAKRAHISTSALYAPIPIFESHGPDRYLRARKDLEPVQRKLFRDVILYITDEDHRLYITDEDHRISDCTSFVIRNRCRCGCSLAGCSARDQHLHGFDRAPPQQSCSLIVTRHTLS